MIFLKLHKWTCERLQTWHKYRARRFAYRGDCLRSDSESAYYYSTQSYKRAKFWNDEERRINLYICAMPEQGAEE
jgi:hypothetical protein